MVSRKIADKARLVAGHLLEAAAEDIEIENGKLFVRGTPAQSVTIQDVALAAYSNLPDDMQYGLEDVHYYDPPNLTYPYGSYIVVVEVDAETGQWHVRRMVALDDCGVRINPMIVDGQIQGGLTEGFAMSSMQWITFDPEGNCIGSNFTDYLIPTAWETPRFELLAMCTPSPHHPIGAKGIGESATVGSPAAFVNAVIDAVAHLGVRNIDMPLLPDRVWSAISEAQT
jgi:carbon-monoxide dehydrogenase large subunit